MFRIYKSLMSRWRNLLCRCRGVKMKGYCRLEKISLPKFSHGISIKEGCALDDGVTLQCSNKDAQLELGKHCYINRYSILDSHNRLTIGDHVMIGPYCYITDAEHIHQTTTSIQESGMDLKETVLGDHSWIGSHVSILAGVSIGKGAVIGAGSVVTKSIPEYAIAYGSPATVKNYRNQ